MATMSLSLGHWLRSGALFAALSGSSHFAVGSPGQTMGAQQTESAYVPSLTFDVASIRESKPADSYRVGGPNPSHASLVNVTNMDVMNLLWMSYGVDRFQISGLPDWAQRAMFNVQAKSDSRIDEQLAKLSDKQAWMEKQHMMQALLLDRFRLQVHWETKEGRVYALAIAKNGPKLHPAGYASPTAEELKNFGGAKVPPLYQRGDGRLGYEFLGHGCSMELLVEALHVQVGAPVVDKTGLTGSYDFTLRYHGAMPDDQNDEAGVWPPLVTALPDQLGLRLEPAKGPIKMLVVDHIERPSEN